MEEHCSSEYAKEAASLMDKNQIGQALDKIFDCAYDVDRAASPTPGVMRRFAAEVFEADQKGVGGDISLKFKKDRYLSYDGFEIK